MKRYTVKGWDNEQITYEDSEGDWVSVDVAQELYQSTEMALKAISQLAEEYGAIPEYLDDITSVLEKALSNADED